MNYGLSRNPLVKSTLSIFRLFGSTFTFDHYKFSFIFICSDLLENRKTKDIIKCKLTFFKFFQHENLHFII
ncbi:hypothetical protein BpHYR1_024487 [Brachionus plicatilis]|uniref:Uncharacterized protein n=1 Tax=Brachionus plicatilis TaxID=10195 RepID=A0A3M7SFP4_BRAPC|nr:hypothetical protein BpHYR1_024487 [Brachionus plicatilis]